MNEELNLFYGVPDHGAGKFEGQLTPSFQEKLQAAHSGLTPEDCHFYHTLDLGDGKSIAGGWDIRGNERNYLGHVNYDNLRVLEFGAASGYLTFWMESQGADVVALDLPPGFPPDLVPISTVDLNKNAASGAVTAEEVRNSWWYGHHARGSKASALYADIYKLPGDIGRYDVSTFGSILLHLGNPIKALEQAAKVTDKALIVTDLIPDVIYGDAENAFVEFNPGNEGENLVNWWRCSPNAIRKMFKVLGFPHVDIHYFEEAYHPHHQPDAPAETRFMFTAVGQREEGMIPRFSKTAEEVETDLSLRKIVPEINIANYNDAHKRLQEAHAELGKIYNSFAWKLTKPLRLLTGK
jgi:O-methyltransferase